MRKTINLYLYKFFGNFQFINDFVRFFYNTILLPILIVYLKNKFPNILFVKKRHSLTDKKKFNAFLSDIDLTIVIKNNSSSKEILQYFFKIKSFLIMLDTPEVYEEKDYTTYEDIQKSSYWNIIYTLWSIRKINWNYKSLQEDNSSLNKIKKLRSIEISLNKILVSPSHPVKRYSLKDFKFLKNFDSSSMNQDNYENKLYLSRFLETDHASSIQLEIPTLQYSKFNALMPGEECLGHNKQLKQYICLYEILLTKASLRIDEALHVNSSPKQEWLIKLEKSLLTYKE